MIAEQYECLGGLMNQVSAASLQAEKNDEVELLELGVSDGRVVGRVKICGNPATRKPRLC